ncbi:MAG: hypothetical protein NTZ46_05700 [Verrucomicrobia bacterium]|nr:hypothetical protein [Verrucomicrobiota bacterium]
MKIPRLFVFGFLALLTGCTTRLTDFTIISTKNVDLSVIGRAKRGAARVEGKDLAHIIIFIPTGVPNMKEAIDRAIESVPGAVALVDGVLYQKFFWIPYIYGQTAYVVEGTPLINTAQASSTLPAQYLTASYNAQQKRFVTQPISAERYEALKAKYALARATQAATL